MFYIFISFLAGITIVVSRIINSNLAQRIGIFQGTFWNNTIGLLFSYLFFLFSNENFNASFSKFQSVPIWAYSGGLLGVLVVVLSSYITPKISAFYLTLLVFIGQLFGGIAIDYFTLDILSMGKLAGGLMVLLGLTYNLLIDRKEETAADHK